MATPVYNPAPAYGGGNGRPGGYGHGRPGGYGHGRTWGVVTGGGSMLGGNTPQYLGGGQPAAEDAGSWFGDSTPVYRAAPSTTTTPSVTPSAATAPQPGPQPGQVAIVVPRS
jgi:hypothetical protein